MISFGETTRGGTPEQNGQDGRDDPEQEERRRIRRRRKLRLNQALLGRSRGGLTSKIHLAADRKCRPLSLVLTAGQAADSPQFVPVLQKIRIRLPVGRPRTRPGAVAADKAYSSRANRSYLRGRGIKAVIPEKRDQTANRKKKGSGAVGPSGHDGDLYKERNSVERLINKLKAWRGINSPCSRGHPARVGVAPDAPGTAALSDEVTQMPAYLLDRLPVRALYLVRHDTVGLHHPTPLREPDRIDIAHSPGPRRPRKVPDRGEMRQRPQRVG